MNALAIAVVNVRRLLRDRTGLFFIFVLPVILIVVLGTMYGGRVAPRMGIVAVDSGALGTELVDAIRNGSVKLELKEPATVDELRAGVEDGTLEIGVIVPPGYDATLRGGGVAKVVILGQPQSAVSALREAVDAAIAGQAAAVRAARLAVEPRGDPVRRGARHRALGPGRDGGRHRRRRAHRRGDLPGRDRGVRARRPEPARAVHVPDLDDRRHAAHPDPPARRLAADGRLAGPQSGRSWSARRWAGSAWPWSRACSSSCSRRSSSASAGATRWRPGCIVVLFALVGTGAAMVVGVFSNNPDQAGALGVMAGMLLGALGGAMVPLEIFPEPAHTIAYLTPHAWAIQGLREVALRDGAVGDVLAELGVLVLYAIALMALGTWRSGGSSPGEPRRPRRRPRRPSRSSSSRLSASPPSGRSSPPRTSRTSCRTRSRWSRARCARPGIAPAGPPFARYFSMSAEGLDIAAGFPVAEPFLGAGVVHPGRAPGGTRGGRHPRRVLPGLEAAWNALRRPDRRDGPAPGDDPWEVYFIGPGSGRGRGRVANGAGLAARARRRSTALTAERRRRADRPSVDGPARAPRMRASTEPRRSRPGRRLGRRRPPDDAGVEEERTSASG